MGIGHVAAGLGLKRVEPRVNAGLLIFAAFLADFLLGWFTWAGWENYEVPADYATSHFLLFTFPWSHGLLPDIVWATALGWAIGTVMRSRRAGMVTGIAVLSHYLLDGLVHVKGLPVAGPGSPSLGLGWWRYLPFELTLEAAMAAAGLVLYWGVAKTQTRARRVGMAAFTVLLALLTIWGQATATVAPPRSALVANWIAAPVVFAAIAGFLDLRTREKALQASPGR